MMAEKGVDPGIVDGEKSLKYDSSDFYDGHDNKLWRNEPKLQATN